MSYRGKPTHRLSDNCPATSSLALVPAREEGVLLKTELSHLQQGVQPLWLSVSSSVKQGDTCSKKLWTRVHLRHVLGPRQVPCECGHYLSGCYSLLPQLEAGCKDAISQRTVHEQDNGASCEERPCSLPFLHRGLSREICEYPNSESKIPLR